MRRSIHAEGRGRWARRPASLVAAPGAVVVLGALMALGGAGCASGGSGTVGGEGLSGAATPEDAVQSFLNAANRDDYRAMARLFGSSEGPAERRLGRTEVEQRMFVLASLLEHQSHALRRSGLTEGPDRIRFLVDMTATRNGDVTVPVLAASHQGRWYVEQVITRSLTGTIR